MEWKKTGVGCIMVGVMLFSLCAYGQEESAPSADAPLMTLDTSSLRSAFHAPGGITDIRLKMQRPTFGSLSKLETEWFIQGVEFRLPVDGLWMGVEKDLGEDVRRATLSLRRPF